MTNKKPIYITENNGNLFYLKLYKYYILPSIIILSGIALYLFFRLMELDLKDNPSIYSVLISDSVYFSMLFCLVSLFFLHQCFERGQRPLILYEDGIDVPRAELSWKVLKMKMNKSLPIDFIPYSQIDRIDTIFKMTGDLLGQIILSPDCYPNSDKRVILCDLHPPLAKEVIMALKNILGTDQLVHWLEKGEMRFGSDSPECHIRAMEVQRELLGDDVVEKLYRKKGNVVEFNEGVSVLEEIQFNSKEERCQFFKHPDYINMEPSIRHRLKKNGKIAVVMSSISGAINGGLFIPLLLDSSGTFSMVLLFLSLTFFFTPLCWWSYSNGKIIYELTGSIWYFSLLLALLITLLVFAIIIYYWSSTVSMMILPLLLLLFIILEAINIIRISAKRDLRKVE